MSEFKHKLTTALAITEVQELAQDLANLPGVVQVDAIPHKSSDLHVITFRLTLSVDSLQSTGFDDPEDLWEVAERMAFRSNRRLRDLTKERWYFHASLGEELDDEDFEYSVIRNPAVVTAYSLT